MEFQKTVSVIVLVLAIVFTTLAVFLGDTIYMILAFLCIILLSVL